MSKFEAEHEEDDPNRFFVLVDDKFDVRINRTEEGIIVDIYPFDGGEPVGSTYAFDSDVDNADDANAVTEKTQLAIQPPNPRAWTAAPTEFATIIDAVTGKQIADFGSPEISEEECLQNLTVGLLAPKLFAFAEQVAHLTKDGEDRGGTEYLMENDTAIALLHELIDEARGVVAGMAGRSA